MKEVFNPAFQNQRQVILNCIQNFQSSGIMLSDGKRNKIKIFELEGLKVSIKSFKKPNWFNKIIYRYFRKSKAERSFEFATILDELKIGTAKPIAYFENISIFGLNDSYFVCEHLDNVFEFRDIVENENFENRIEIIRQFTRFTAYIHEKGVEFLDHSPGNTLIRENKNKNYSFFLVDLNRMRFHKKLDFNTRMKNLSKITHKKDMIKIMSNEYAKILNQNEQLIFDSMWSYTAAFQFNFHRKKRIKKKLKFWKK